MRKFLIILLVLIVLGGGVWFYYNRDDLKKSNDNDLSDVKKEVTDYKGLLLKVLNNESEFIDKDNNKILINNYKFEGNETKAKEYAFIDLDDDGIEELVVNTTSDYGFYLIFHYEDNNIYGYGINTRSFENLKTDGSFVGSSGAGNQEYFKMSFNKNNYSLISEALNDEVNGVYKIKGEDVSKDKINDFLVQFNKRIDVEFKSI